MNTSGGVDEKLAKGDGEAVEANGRKGSYVEGDLENIIGYKPELDRNRSLFTLLFQSLAIAAIPYGEGSPLISAIYGGGQLSIFLGWIVVLILVRLLNRRKYAGFADQSGYPPAERMHCTQPVGIGVKISYLDWDVVLVVPTCERKLQDYFGVSSYSQSCIVFDVD
jgi:hypothetical protein